MKIIIENKSNLQIKDAMVFANEIINDSVDYGDYCPITIWSISNIGVSCIKNKKSVRIVIFNPRNVL